MIFVMGATGHVGSKIVNHLLSNGQQVRCLARHFPDEDAFEGAELVEGDANEVATVTDCMRGCSAAFILLPPNMKTTEVRFSQNKLGEVIAEAIEESGIRKIVNLSSIGGDLSSGTGIVLGLHDQEERLNEITHPDIVHLRPTFFMENLLIGIPSIIAMNRYFGSVPGEVPVPMVATQDIAARAAFLLMNPNFTGRSVEYLLGERTLTFNEAIRAIGQAIEKPDLEYVEVSPAEERNGMIGAGLSAAVADALLELDHAITDGTLVATVTRDKLNTTATSIEEFARTTFKEAYTEAMEHTSAPRRPEPPKDVHP